MVNRLVNLVNGGQPLVLPRLDKYLDVQQPGTGSSPLQVLFRHAWGFRSCLPCGDHSDRIRGRYTGIPILYYHRFLVVFYLYFDFKSMFHYSDVYFAHIQPLPCCIYCLFIDFIVLSSINGVYTQSIG